MVLLAYGLNRIFFRRAKGQKAPNILGKLQLWVVDCNDSRLFPFSFSTLIVRYKVSSAFGPVSHGKF